MNRITIIFHEIRASQKFDIYKDASYLNAQYYGFVRPFATLDITDGVRPHHSLPKKGLNVIYLPLSFVKHETRNTPPWTLLYENQYTILLLL